MSLLTHYLDLGVLGYHGRKAEELDVLDENRRILIIDANPQDQRSLAAALASAGDGSAAIVPAFEIDFSDNADSALKLAQLARDGHRPYAAVFLDPDLGSGDGLALVRMIWEFIPDTTIVLTSRGQPHEWIEILQKLGISENLLVLEKPLSPLTARQTALATVTRWNISESIRVHIEDLEATVEKRTGQLNETVRQLTSNLETLKDTQQRMVETSKLAALGEMAGGIAHEINTPLATITLLSEQIQDLLGENDPDLAAAGQMLGKLSTTAHRIAKIVLGLRAFSREAGGDPYRSEPVCQLIDATLSFCKSRFEGERIALIIEPFDQTLAVYCKPVPISQVLLNLLNNSRDAIASLPEKWIRIAVQRTEGSVSISVTDSGSGIPGEVVDKVFQPFFTTKPVGKGTGLGLSISKGIVESHGGTLEVDRKCPNTRIVVCLPDGKRG